MQRFIVRSNLLTVVSGALREAPAVALLGARQVGKTTLAQQVAAAWPGQSRILDLEVPAVREALARTPATLLGSSDGLVVVDYATQRGAELDLLLLRRGRRWGFEFKCTDAPRTTRAMHITIADLGLDHLWVVYPGSVRYSLTDRITALPLAEVDAITFHPMA